MNDLTPAQRTEILERHLHDHGPVDPDVVDAAVAAAESASGDGPSPALGARVVARAWVDAGFKQDLALHGAVLGVDVEVVKRSDTRPGFVPVRKRWIVEQTYGTLMLHRRLVREYESRPESAVSRTLWASMVTIVRRLTGTSTPSWRHR